MNSEGKELESMCTYARLVKPEDNASIREDVLFCNNLEAAVNDDYIQSGCVASQVFPTGHSRLDAYFIPEKLYECPYRKVE